MKKSLLILTIVILLITGCQSNQNKNETVMYDPPRNPLVAKPDEIYVGTPRYITRVIGDSPWFNAFWTIADNGAKATKIIYQPTGNRLFEMSGLGTKEPPNEKCGRFLPHKPFLPEPLKEGQTILAEAATVSQQKDSSVFLVLWYKNLADLKVGDYPPSGSHLLEVQKLGFPMRADGTLQVRQLTIQTPINSYMLILQGTKKVVVDDGRDYYYGGVAYYGHLIDDIKYRLSPDLIQTYEKFRKTEVKISEKN